MTRKYLYLGACSEIILARPNQEPLVGYIARNSPTNNALHLKARELADENYLDDFAAELNEDYFNGELEFEVSWSHSRYERSPKRCKVIGDDWIPICYLFAGCAYTESEDVVEYLLMHEMAHMLEMLRVKDSKMSSINTAMNHHYAFWLIVARNPNAVNGHHLFLGKDFPIDLTPLSKRKIYIDPRSKGTRLASTGYPEGETIKILPKGM